MLDDRLLETQVYRPGFGRALAVAVLALASVGTGTSLISDPGATWPYLAPVALVVVTVWAAFWHPAVVVNPAGVQLRNVLRTVELPWPTIQRIDTKYALTLYTAYGSYSAWAAPAPGRMQTELAAKGTGARHLPESAYGHGGVRPGDLPGTGSGPAAYLVRSRWEALRDAGLLDNPRLERERPKVTWHIGALAAIGALLAASALSLAFAHG